MTQTYRADIEGLRALAVALVIFYHYGFPGIPGGFIGVDVFFVISGFVITLLLKRQFTADTFQFRDFYARRIRRLVPVFLLISTVTFLLISPFYFKEDYYVFAKSWLASLVGLSNFYYFDELSQYFSVEAQSMPLLHTWSLAVEEQFYLIWPATLYLAYRFWRGRNGVWAFGVLLICAFALSVYVTQLDAKAAFYLLPARIYELMLGAGLALFGHQLHRLSRYGAELVALLGVVLIIATAVLLTSAHAFPGLNALWPTLGTALVIYAGIEHRQTLVARALSLPTMVFLGGISYSLYLWHWPPVALLHYQLIEMTWPIRLGLIAAVVLLSWLSYRYVENRYRYRPWGFKKSFLIFILAPFLVIWAIQSTIRIVDDLSFRITPERRALYQMIEQNAGETHKRCFKADPVDFDKSARCLFGPAAPGEPNAVFIGDSHATALIGFVEQLLPGTDLSLLLVTQASTAFVIGERADAFFAGDEEKVDRNVALTDYLSGEPMTVLLGAWWNAYLANPANHEHFMVTLEWLLERGHQIVVVEDVPELPSSAYAHCLLKSMADCSIDAAEVNQRLEQFNRFKQSAQQRYPQIMWINPRDVICDEARCETVLNGIPLYRDESHLNHVGSTEMGRVYRERFGNPLLELQGVAR